MAKIWIACLLVLIALLAGGCEVDPKGFDTPPVASVDSCVDYDFTIIALPYERLPNTGIPIARATDTSFTRDSDGVMLSEFHGKHYYHPVGMAHKCYQLIDVFHQTQDSAHLDLLVKYIDRMIAEAIVYDSALYYPYHFDYNVNQQEDGFLADPWFSGMAQGEILGVLVRTFQTTGDSTYLDYAHRTFYSFLRLQGEAEPWTVFVDEAGCYWIEEYPVWPPSKTLNGFIFAIYGLYDYYQLTQDPEAERILKSCFSTIKNCIHLFRRPERPSFYGLRFGHFTAEYHKTHSRQLDFLERFTGDAFFGAWADTLRADYDKDLP
jgi:hypothetical protein